MPTRAPNLKTCSAAPAFRGTNFMPCRRRHTRPLCLPEIELRENQLRGAELTGCEHGHFHRSSVADPAAGRRLRGSKTGVTWKLSTSRLASSLRQMCVQEGAPDARHTTSGDCRLGRPKVLGGP